MYMQMHLDNLNLILTRRSKFKPIQVWILTVANTNVIFDILLIVLHEL